MSGQTLALTVASGRARTLYASLLTGMALLFGLGTISVQTKTATAQTTPSYEIKDLGTLGGIATPWGIASTPYDINDSGQVVGCAATASGQYHAFFYDSTNGMKDLGTLGGDTSCAYGVNNSGQVVGYWGTDASSEYHAFLWDSTNGMKDLGTLGGTNSYAYDINNSGQVVGSSDTASGETHAFLYDSTNGMKDISVPESPGFWNWPWGPYSLAYDINDSGQVVGGTNDHAFRYDIGTKTLKDLGVLGGIYSSSEAYSINASGQVVGWSHASSDTVSHAFLYSGGSMQDLGSLGLQNAIPQNWENWADDINDSGQIVGHSGHGNYNDAFLYQNGQMIDLSTRLLPEDRDVWKLAESASINNDGQIVVAGYPYTSAGIDFTEHALLLTPTTTVPTAPSTPSTPDLDGSSDTGASQTDNLTNDDTPTFTGTADEGSTVKIYVDGAEKGSGTATGGRYNITTSTLQAANHSITAKASNGSAQSGESQSLNITIDKTAPSVYTVSPKDLATKVSRNTSLTANFYTEKMDPLSINKSTFKLYKCSSTTSTTCTTQITDVGVKLSADGLTATLDPYPSSSKSVLGSTTKYKAIVTTGAKDMAGNALDQSPTTSGNQQKEWTFTTGTT